jgi:hypothetical protein
MNQPIFPQPQQQWGQPQPQQYAQPQQQQWGQPQQPQQQFTPPVHGAAANNLLNQFLSEPPRQRVDRSKAPDGTYIVRVEADTTVQQSQKDARFFLAIRYTICEGTVPQVAGRTFGHVIFWTTRNQLQDLADLAKYVFGQALPQVTAQTGGDPKNLAYVIAEATKGKYCKLVVRRSQKQARQGIPYDDQFANHEFTMFLPQPFTLAQAGVQPSQQMPQMPQMQAPAMMQPQQPPMGMPPAQQQWQPPAQQPAPQMQAPMMPPAQAQQAWVPPAPPAPQPQPQQGWAPPAQPPQQQAPAFFVPPAAPPAR